METRPLSTQSDCVELVLVAIESQPARSNLWGHSLMTKLVPLYSQNQKQTCIWTQILIKNWNIGFSKLQGCWQELRFIRLDDDKATVYPCVVFIWGEHAQIHLRFPKACHHRLRSSHFWPPDCWHTEDHILATHLNNPTCSHVIC